MPNWFHVSHFHSDQSPVNMEEITLTFLSDACSDYYTDNTISSFRNKLSSPLQLSQGEWEIALTSVSYTGGHYINEIGQYCAKLSGFFKSNNAYSPHIRQKLLYNFTSVEQLFEYITDDTDTTENACSVNMKIKKNGFGKYEITRTMETPYYKFLNGFDYMFGVWETEKKPDSQRLFDAMIYSEGEFHYNYDSHFRLFQQYGEKDIFMHHHDSSDKILTILVKGITNHPDGRINTVGKDVDYDVLLKDISVEKRIHMKVDYNHPMCFDTQAGRHLPDLLMGRSKLLIYCDLIPPQYVGGTVAPLLRMIPSQEGRITEHFSSPTYFKLNRDYIDEFHIYIKHENGKPPAFELGTFSGTLSLRKRA